ncbi:MAG TPA: hypothetical protein VK809_10100 [Bacteroidia bacterium]|jgi:hypothetical protein|nr:hypothetical protein [Bacteroidia bacterium]
MYLTEVNDNKTINDFHKPPFKIYKGDPNWVSHIKQEVESVFDRKINPYFSHSEATRWVLYNDRNEPVGRVAAFINKKTAFTFEQPTGGMGFFECINDRNAAVMLFDKCRDWLMERGMKAMDGPINFGEKDRYWGLLSEGADKPAIYTMNHNPEYYRHFFEEYGFTKYYEQIVYCRSAIEPPSARLNAVAERVTRNKEYRYERIKKNQEAKYAEDFRTIYNKAWKAERSDYEEMTSKRALEIMNKMKPIIDEDTCWYVYHNDTPVGVYISIPELNEVFRYVNGNLNWLGKLKTFWYLKTKPPRTTMGIVFGIVPEFQGKGLEAGMFTELGKVIQPKKSYDRILINWIGDFNEKMIHLLVALLQVVPYKKFITYRKIF